MCGVASVWATRDPLGALGWLQGNLEGGLAEAFGQVAAVLTAADAAAAQYLFKVMPPGTPRESEVNAVARTLFANDPEAAMNWIRSVALSTRSQPAVTPF